jgi:hypothetical protein
MGRRLGLFALEPGPIGAVFAELVFAKDAVNLLHHLKRPGCRIIAQGVSGFGEKGQNVSMALGMGLVLGIARTLKDHFFQGKVAPKLTNKGIEGRDHAVSVACFAPKIPQCVGLAGQSLVAIVKNRIADPSGVHAKPLSDCLQEAKTSGINL